MLLQCLLYYKLSKEEPVLAYALTFVDAKTPVTEF
jgi:hypothetical protein